MQGMDDANVQTIASRCVFSFRFPVGSLEPDAVGSTVLPVNLKYYGRSRASENRLSGHLHLTL